jgi:hypothetical protein
MTATPALEQQQAVSGDVVERLSQQIANAMQRARAECGGDRVSFAYAEAAMRSELRAALKASGVERWQPIETAPKQQGADGQLGICVATAYGSRWSFNHAWWDDAVEEWTDIHSDRYLNPTHWTPLPKLLSDKL